MIVFTKRISVLFVTLVVVLGIGFNAQGADKIRIALGDVASVETLCFLVALDRAKDRGLDYELTAFAKEQLAIQAVIGGQMDIGIGTPYYYPENQGSHPEFLPAEQACLFSGGL